MVKEVWDPERWQAAVAEERQLLFDNVARSEAQQARTIQARKLDKDEQRRRLNRLMIHHFDISSDENAKCVGTKGGATERSKNGKGQEGSNQEGQRDRAQVAEARCR